MEQSSTDNENDGNEKEPIYYYANKKDNVLVFNTTPFYKHLSDVHMGIDAIHDQMDTTRGCSRLTSNKKYKQKIQNAIIAMSIGSGKGIFSTSQGKYNLTQSAHTLSSVFDRPTYNTTFTITVNDEPRSRTDLYPYVQMTEQSFSDVSTDLIKNTHLELVGYNPKLRDESARMVREKYGIQDTHFVLDCGPKEIFSNLTAQNDQYKGTSTSVFSGILDSSSSSDRVQTIKEHYQVFIPFMKINTKKTIMLYATPVLQNNNYVVHMAFCIYENIEIPGAQAEFNRRKRNDNINHTHNQDNFVSEIIDSVPTLPDISQYLGAEMYNFKYESTTEGSYLSECVDFFTKTVSRSVIKKCEPFRNIVDTLLKSDSKLQRESMMIQFFILLKHFGDRFRAIDSVILSKNTSNNSDNSEITLCLTGTGDTFLMRFISLSNMYGCFVNIKNKLILHNIKNLSPKELDAINKQNKEEKNIFINNRISDIEHIIAQFTERRGEISETFGEIKNALTNYFINMAIFRTRRTLRRLISCVSSKHYFVKGTNIIFDEINIQIVWKCLQIFKLLIRCYKTDNFDNFVGMNDLKNIYNTEQNIDEQNIEKQLDVYYKKSLICKDILDIMDISDLNTIIVEKSSSSVPIVDISDKICNKMNLSERIINYSSFIGDVGVANSEWSLGILDAQIGGASNDVSEYITRFDEFITNFKFGKLSWNKIEIKHTKTRAFISFINDLGKVYSIHIHWLFTNFHDIAAYLDKNPSNDYPWLTELYEQIRLQHFKTLCPTYGNLDDQSTSENKKFTLHMHYGILKDILIRTFEKILVPDGTSKGGGKSDSNKLTELKNQIDAAFETFLKSCDRNRCTPLINGTQGSDTYMETSGGSNNDMSTVESQFNTFTELSRKEAAARNVYSENKYQSQSDYINMLEATYNLTSFYLDQYKVAENDNVVKVYQDEMGMDMDSNVVNEEYALQQKIKDLEQLIQSIEETNNTDVEGSDEMYVVGSVEQQNIEPSVTSNSSLNRSLNNKRSLDHHSSDEIYQNTEDSDEPSPPRKKHRIGGRSMRRYNTKNRRNNKKTKNNRKLKKNKRTRRKNKYNPTKTRRKVCQKCT